MADENIVKKLMEDIKTKAEELKDMYTTLQMLKKYDASIKLPDLAALVSGAGDTVGTIFEIRPDHFFGMSQTDATEKYLRMVGHAATLDDIFDALNKGGIKFSTNGRNNLNIQLTRATRKFAKIGSGNSVSFGLLEWYPSRAKKKAAATANSAEYEEDSQGENSAGEEGADEGSESAEG